MASNKLFCQSDATRIITYNGQVMSSLSAEALAAKFNLYATTDYGKIQNYLEDHCPFNQSSFSINLSKSYSQEK